MKVSGGMRLIEWKLEEEWWVVKESEEGGREKDREGEREREHKRESARVKEWERQMERICDRERMEGRDTHTEK